MVTAGFEAAAVRRRSSWKVNVAVIAVSLAAVFVAFGGLDVIGLFRHPSKPFELQNAPPAPDYASNGAWLAFPGRNGLERSIEPGTSAVNEQSAPADVFFIHPTTGATNSVWNEPYDAAGADVPLFPPVLLQQASTFNGCCRIYAPHYRQASLAGLKNPQASALAYRDVERAFRYYLDHYNKGRPFIIASHSQGTGLAVRLLQDDVVGQPQQSQMIAAYLIGGFVPVDFSTIGVPICDSPDQTGCLISWNTAQTGRSQPRKIIRASAYWWQGSLRTKGQPEPVCVNPLTWRKAGAASAAQNGGSLSFPVPPFSANAGRLQSLIPELTGAVCDDGILNVDVPWSQPGFLDKLSLLVGSYHMNDYGIFYAAIRRNAVERTAAWLKARRTTAAR